MVLLASSNTSPSLLLGLGEVFKGQGGGVW